MPPPTAADEGQELAEVNRERQPLLPAAAASKPKDEEQQPASPGGAAPPARVKSQELGQCRICLEEDSLPSLETPCGCTGTQRHAHKECIQKWVNEKRALTCEICDQAYKGSYVVPPPPPPQPAGEPLTLVSPLGNLYLTVDPSERRLLADAYDEWDDHRQPTVSWCFSFMMLLLLMMFLQGAMPVGDAPGSGGSTPGGGPVGPPAPGADPAAAAGSAAVGLVAGLSLFLVWLLSKLILVVFPLLMVMRLAARAQEEAAAEAAAAAAAVPGLDAPASGTRRRGGGGSFDADAERDSPLAALIARLAAARAAAAARSSSDAAPAGSSAAAAHGSSNGSSSSTIHMVDLEAEVNAARRAALSRLGRDPSFWSSVAAAAASAEGQPAAGSSSAGQQQAAAAAASAATAAAPQAENVQQQGEGVPPQHRVASLRALMQAIRGAALRRQGYEETGQADAAQAPAGGGGSTDSRVQHGVV